VNFLNIGTLELMVIIAIAILAIGPKRMVQVARTIGRMATRLRQISGEFTSILRTEFAELDEARQEVQGAIGEFTGSQGEQAASEVTGAVDGAKAAADQSVGSLIEDGLGLRQIASELKAASTEARAFVEKAATEAASEVEAEAAPAEGGTADTSPESEGIPEADGGSDDLHQLEAVDGDAEEVASQTDEQESAPPESVASAGGDSPDHDEGQTADVQSADSAGVSEPLAEPADGAPAGHEDPGASAAASGSPDEATADEPGEGTAPPAAQEIGPEQAAQSPPGPPPADIDQAGAGGGRLATSEDGVSMADARATAQSPEQDIDASLDRVPEPEPGAEAGEVNPEAGQEDG
jgi:sec-independent protein translocase protein TatB